MARHELWELKQMQSLPLQAKIQMTRQRIRGWIDEFGEDGVYVSFSGGKDSTVLLDIVRKDYPNVEAVFVNTGLEYPSVRKFAESKENVKKITPTMTFRDILIKYGYPVISKEVSQCIYEARLGFSNNDGTYQYRIDRLNGTYKDKNGNLSNYNMPQYKFLLDAPFIISDFCCDKMKKEPSHNFEIENDIKPIIATMADESRLRLSKWLEQGCNSFDTDRPTSKPMSFWTENDVLQYIRENNLPIAEAYGEVVVKGTESGQMCIADILEDYRGCQYVTTGCKRTGCIFCMFGITQDKDRFIRLAEQEPKLCDYVMRGGEFGENGMWQPSKNGLGYWFVIEWLNVHGNLKIGMPDRRHYLNEYKTEETRKYLEVE